MHFSAPIFFGMEINIIAHNPALLSMTTYKIYLSYRKYVSQVKNKRKMLGSVKIIIENSLHEVLPKLLRKNYLIQKDFCFDLITFQLGTFKNNN